MAGTDLGRRLAVAVIGIPLVTAALYLGGWVLGLSVAGVAALAAKEFYSLAEARGAEPFSSLGVAGAAGLVLLATLRPSLAGVAPSAFGGLVLLTVGLLGAAVWLRWPGGQPLGAVSVTLTGVLYTGATLAFIPLLRGLPQASGESVPWPAMGFVLLPLLTTWAGDSAGYFVGKAWGRAKLAPHVSPAKTWVGAVAGLGGSALAAVVLTTLVIGGRPALELDIATAAGIGLLLGAVGQLGDLVESMLKREAGVKDSGSLLPGHGGILDRVDSLLFSIPAAWGLLVLVIE